MTKQDNQNNAMISIMSMTADDNGFNMPSELVTNGHYYKDGNEYVVRYEESILTGLGDTITTFRIGQDSINLLREGDVFAEMVFEPRKKHISVVETDVGCMTMGISGAKLGIDLDDEGGRFMLQYDVDMDCEKLHTNSVVVTISEVTAR